MSGEDKPYMDMLMSVAGEVRRYSGEVAEFVDENFDRAADVVRDHLSTATWLPEAVRANLPLPRPPPPPPVDVIPTVSLTLYERAQDWVMRHRILVSFLALTVGTVAYRSVRRVQSSRKFRRARRARNGARCEVVVIAASPSLPVTQSLALDMERRGFIVYIICGSAEDEHAVRQLSRPDIRPLSIDITDSVNAGAALDRFALYLHAPHAAVPGARKSHLTLTAVIIIPSLNYQTSPIATIPPSNFADLFNTHLLHPILSIQAFLPLLTARTALQPGEKPPPSLLSTASSMALANIGGAKNKTKNTSKAGEADDASKPPSDRIPPPPKVLVFSPSIISSVNPPFHAPESTVCSALTAFTEVLAAELRPLGIPVTHIQLGTFDFSGFAPPPRSAMAQQLSNTRIPPPAVVETLAWSEPARHVYGRNYTAQSTTALGSGRAIHGLRGTAMRDLHHAVFDVLDGSNTGSVVRVGLGANLYGFVGNFMPRGLVAWMMGVRKVDGLESLYSAPVPPASSSSAPTPNASVLSTSSESSGPPIRRSNSTSKNSETTAGFVAVAADEAVADSHIWQ
ncbi:duf1776 domain containing protein [Grosmannia clavigera kw1407]|uniref:Duf1776 domain containing protein n=1 Tax=Grosmannia clavigera (strain kw1407 / UAMH 11150) TaxID=655863 RepID=F0XDP5_GROCL|nr:duf1776 domain containing protein [Grosmannia clavigera kw1407]EFX04771.1 duf1776 domain containing protein [Grosmannia clavigera kw1407]